MGTELFEVIDIHSGLTTNVSEAPFDSISFRREFKGTIPRLEGSDDFLIEAFIVLYKFN